MRKFLIWALPFAVIGFAEKAQAQNDYQFKALTNYSYSDTKFSDKMLQDTKTIYVMGGLNYYFIPVDIEKGPLALAPFLDRSSLVNFSYGSGKYTAGEQKENFRVFNLAGNYVHQSSGFLAYGNFYHAQVDLSPDYITKSYDITVGKYVAENSIVTIGYKKEDADFGAYEQYTLSNFHAEELSHRTFYDAGFALSYINNENSNNLWSLDIKSTYYFTKRASVGLSGSYKGGEDINVFGYGIHSEIFVVNGLSLHLSYQKMNTNDDQLVDYRNNVLTGGLSFLF